MRRLLLLLGSIVLAATAQAQTFNVFAAASLKEAATTICRNFEKMYPQVHVTLNFGGTQQLVAQIKQGAPCDVLLGAGFEPLKGLDYEQDSLRVFATNELALIVPAGSRKIAAIHDLGSTGSIIIANRRVPVGDYTEKMLAKLAGVYGTDWVSRFNRRVVSKEQDVRAVLTKVALGEADAGFVYISDVPAAKGRVRTIPIPELFNVEAHYPVVRFAHSYNSDLAKDFTKYLFEPGPQRVLASYGFGSPILSGRPILLTSNGHSQSLDVQALPEKPFSANDHGKNVKFKGRDLGSTLKGARGLTIQIVGADGYTQTVKLHQSLEGGMFLVAMPAGNFELILPRQQPSTWVHWVREITVQ